MTSILALKAYPEPRNRHLKLQKIILPISAIGKLLGHCFHVFKGDCSALKRPRELKLITLKPPGNEDSEYQFLKSLCDEIGVC
jgi:hypothetical protein